MANLFAAGASGASWDNLTETAFNRAADFALRDLPVWANVVDTKPNAQAMPGDIVTFTIHKDLAAQATTPLTETVDPDSVAPQAPTRVSVTLNEYGNATLETLRLKETAFIPPDPALATIVGRNMIDTHDTLIRTVADGSSNTIGLNNGVILTATSGTAFSVAAVKSTDTFNRTLAAATVTKLRGDKVTPAAGENYLAICHPNVLHDLMAENSATAWVAPHTYGTDTGAVYNGVVGTFMGAQYMSTTRCKSATDGLSSAVVYRSYFLGQQAIAEAVAVDPHIVVGPQVDKLKRFFPLGWYSLIGWALYRPEALRLVHSSTSVTF